LVRILPGVEIQVVKEIVPQQLHPAGVVGLMGTAEKGPVLTSTPVTSFREYQDKFGSDISFSLTRDAKACFMNGVFEVFATRIEATGSTNAYTELKDVDGDAALRIESQIPGESGNKIKYGLLAGPVEGTYALQISDGVKLETYDNVSLDKSSELYIMDLANKQSKLVTFKDLMKKTKTPKNLSLTQGELSGGVTAQPDIKDYEKALEMLELEEDVDIVIAADCWDPKVHALIDAHCMNMSKDAKNRIGVGTVAPGESVADIVKRNSVLASDRFVLVAPYGVAGAVAGLISKLNYYESPTFKALTGVADLERRYMPSELMELLKAGVLPLEARRGRGIIVEKGILTSKEQISVMRIADHSVRGTKNIAENFIGTLNTVNGRSALKEKITEFFIQMEKENAIVPSTDGKEPSYLIDVYSSQMDFAQGIVRVDIAVRPIRAMDYIYATITVQA
jgi:hypothetical protein